MSDVQPFALFGRKASLVVSDESGNGLEVGELRLAFEVQQWESATPNSLDVTITNLSKATSNRMMKEFTRVRLMAGYESQYGIIFDGTIVQARRGRTGVYTYLALTAADGDRAHNFAVVNTTLAAGATPADIHAAACNAMEPHGVTQGYTADMPGPALPRGRVLYGMAREVMTDNARSTNTQWTILDGRVQFIPQYGYAPGEAVVLTSETGLIGLPQQTQDGILVRCLLNPLLRVNNRIKLDNGSIQEARIGLDPNSQAQAGLLPKKDSDGLYRILAVSHAGDTRGGPWYSDLVCISADPNAFIPLSQVQRGRGGAFAPPLGLPVQPATVGSFAA